MFSLCKIKPISRGLLIIEYLADWNKNIVIYFIFENRINKKNDKKTNYNPPLRVGILKSYKHFNFSEWLYWIVTPRTAPVTLHRLSFYEKVREDPGFQSLTVTLYFLVWFLFFLKLIQLPNKGS